MLVCVSIVTQLIKKKNGGSPSQTAKMQNDYICS